MGATMPEENEASLENEYMSFLAAVKNIVNIRIDALKDDKLEGLARVFAGSVFDTIGSQEAKDVIDCQSKLQDKRVLKAFTAELKFFNARYGPQKHVDRFHYPQDSIDSQRAKDDSAVGDAETVKESLRKIFTLPEWFDKALEILDELLSLVKSIKI